MRRLLFNLMAGGLLATGTAPHTATHAEDGLPNLWTREVGVDWPTFLGPTGDSKSSEKGLITPWPAEGPRIVWKRELGVGYGIGSISKGRLFQFDRHANRARLYCLQAETGKEIWRYEYETRYRDMLGYNNGPRCSPLIDDDRVYAFGVEGKLFCVSALDGKLIWEKDTEKEFGVVTNFFGVGSTPIIENDLLICMIGGSPANSPGLYESGGAVEGNGTGIVAFDKRTGKERYRISDELASYASLKAVTIDERRWCFAFCRKGLLGFEPATGTIDFHYPWRSRKLESVNASTPVVFKNNIFISETYGIGSSMLSVKPGGYSVTWKDDRRKRDKSMMTHWNTPIYVDGFLYGCSGRNEPDADLRCLDWKTGEVQWIEKLPPEFRERTSLLYVDGHFIVLGEFGTLKLIRVNPQKYDVVSEVLLLRDPASDGPLKDRRIPLLLNPCWAAPILSHGLLYVRGRDQLVCLEVIPEEKR